MINLFNLSKGKSGAEAVMDQTHKDGFPVQRIKSELKTIDLHKVHVDEKIAAGDNSVSKKLNTTSLKMLLAKETSKELESKRKPPSVVARLMGLEEDLPAKESVLHHTERDFSKSQSCSQPPNNGLQWQEQHSIQLMTRVTHPSSEAVEYNGAYERCEEQARKGFFQDQSSQRRRYSEKNSEKMNIVREKFMQAKCFAMEEKLLHSENLQEALEVLSSKKDIFLKFREEPNSIFSRHLSGLRTTPAPPQTKRITVLKPVRSVGSKCVSRTERVIQKNGLEMRKFHQMSSSKEAIPSQPSRIVLLRPSPGKSSLTKAKLTPKATPFRLIDQTDFIGVLDDNGATLGSTGAVYDSVQHRRYGCHLRDESLLSSTYSNGYGGDESSFSDSEIDHNGDSEIDCTEEDGGSISDSEGGSPLSKCSWDYIRRYGSSYSGSSLSKISNFPESSVIKEAKQRLSERWTMVTCDEISKEQVQCPRSTCTLGEMLCLQEVKKEDSIGGVHSVSGNLSCVTKTKLVTEATYVTTCRKDDKNEEMSRKLPRSKSVPVISSIFDNTAANMQASNPEDCKPTKEVLMSNKEKSSFKGRVSDFFYSRRKPIRQKASHHTSGCFDERVESYFGDSQSAVNRYLETNETVAFCENKVDISAIQKSTSTPKGTVSIDVPISLLCPREVLQLNEGLSSTRDQPSPTSVLDAPSEDSSCNEPESSGSTTSKNARAVSRSSAIEAVTCSLSWDDATSQSPLLGTPRPPYLHSDVDDDESECHILVQNIMSSAGLDDAQSSIIFTGWHLPDCPLDPVLYNKLLELRKQRSYQRLIFDCVNVALVEIGENALLSVFPWSKAQTRTRRDTSSPALGLEVWRILRDWIYGTQMFAVSKKDNTGIMMDKIVKQEVEGSCWVKMMRSQVVDITEQIEGGVLEELVGEAVLDFATCF